MRSLLLVLALIAAPSAAFAQGVPVHDAPSFAMQVRAWAKQAAVEAEQLGRWAQQAKNMVDLLSWQNLMSTVLGEGVGGEFEGLLKSADGLYQDTNGLINSISAKRYQMSSELDSLMLPGSMDQMTPEQMVALVRRYSTFFGNDTAQARAIQAEGIAVQAIAADAARRGLAQSDKSVSALSATQALSHIAMGISSQLQTTNYTLGTMAMQLSDQVMDETIQRNVAETLSKRNADAMRQWTSSVGQAGQSPVTWGR